MNRQSLGKLFFLPQLYNEIKDLVLRKNRIVVMMFHHIEKQEYMHFRDLIKFLYENYQVITPEEFEYCMDGKRLKGKYLKVLLSFDDGFQSDYFVAKNILDTYNMKAVHFIAPTFIECQTSEEIWSFVKSRLLLNPDGMKDFLPMTWDEIQALQKSGHKIGAHTYTHLRCNKQSIDVLDKEIRGAGDYLAEKLGAEIDWFAFPFGDITSISSESAEIAQRRYHYVFSAVRGYNCFLKNQGMLYREAVSMQDEISYVRFVLEGGLMPYYRSARYNLRGMVGRI